MSENKEDEGKDGSNITFADALANIEEMPEEALESLKKLINEKLEQIECLKKLKDERMKMKHPKRRCEGCFLTKTSQKLLKTCKRCRIPSYCSRECQLASWPVHKMECSKVDAQTHLYFSFAFQFFLSVRFNSVFELKILLRNS